MNPSSVADQSRQEEPSYNQSGLKTSADELDHLDTDYFTEEKPTTLQDRLNQALATAAIFKSCIKKGPYSYENNKDAFDRDIAFFEKLIRDASKQVGEGTLGKDPVLITKNFLEIQEVLLAMKFIKRDITFIKGDDMKDLGTALGSGDFGTVRLCETHGVKCAVKQFDMTKNIYKMPYAINSYYLESYAARKATSPNVVKVLGFSIEPFRVVTEYAECGSLSTFLADNYKTLSRTEKFSIALGVLNGLDWVTNVPNILHQDIKPDNILIDKSHTPKISDFGFVRFLREENEAPAPQGNLLHRAPESLKRSRPYSCKSSVIYAFGLILYSIMTGRVPYTDFVGDSAEELVKTVCDERRLPTLSGVPAEVEGIVVKCLSSDPDARPPFDAVKDMLWEAYITREIPEEAPRAFWNARYSKVFEVPFDALVKGFPVIPSEKVRTVFCGENCRNITPQKFGELHALFGPWYEPSNGHIFEEVAGIIDEDWFLVGPKDMVDGAVGGSGAKTFGVRLSNTTVGSPFCVVCKGVNKTLKYLVRRTSMNPTMYFCGGIKAVSVQDIIRELRRKGYIENHYVPEERSYNFTLTK